VQLLKLIAVVWRYEGSLDSMYAGSDGRTEMLMLPMTSFSTIPHACHAALNGCEEVTRESGHRGDTKAFIAGR